MIDIKKGDQISHFIFRDEVAKGGYGKVYKCNIEGSPKNQYVALKIVPNSRSKSLENEKKILDEIQNIGTYFPVKHDAACCASFYYIAMEYISFSLDKVVLEQDRKYKILSIALKTLECIKVLHEHNIIHRDIKPPNFLIREDNTLCLIDFGFSVHYIVNGRHIDDGYGRSIVGTSIYQSIRSHDGNVSSRRDDMESWIYLLLFLYKKGDENSELWENCEDSEMPIRKKQIARRELSNIEPLCSIYEDIMALSFKKQPDYDGYKQRIIDTYNNLDPAPSVDIQNVNLIGDSQDSCCLIC